LKDSDPIEKIRIQVEPRDELTDNYMELKPLLPLWEKRNAIMISPMTRYIKHSCCDDRKHITNWKDTSYKPAMMAALTEAKQNLRDFLFHDGKRTLKVLNPNLDIKTMTEEEVRGHNPVHPLPQVYSKIAEAVVKLAATMKESQDKKRRRTDSGDTKSGGDSDRRDSHSHNRGH
jgi:hypothetical protein